MPNSQNLKNTIRIGTSIFLGGILNYIFQYIMVQKLTIHQYADLSSLLGLINIIGTITLGLSLFVVKQFSKNLNNISSNIKVYKKILLKIGFSLFLICSFTIPFLSLYLNLPIILLLICFFSIFLFSISIYQWAFFQSSGNFIYTSLLQIFNPLFRIVAAYIFILFGFGVYGAMGGFIVSQILLFILGGIAVKRLTKNIPLSKDINEGEILSSFLSQKKQILQYLATSILIALLMNIDILIVKNIFDGETAGYYAAVSVLAKFLVFLGLSIETVYYPQLVKESVLPKIALLKVSVYYAAMTLGAVVFFILFGEMILRLFKDGLEDYISLIYPLLIYCGLLGYLSIIVKTLIAFEQYTINYLLGALIVGLVICLYSLGTSLLAVTQIFAVFGLLGLGLGVSQLIRR